MKEERKYIENNIYFGKVIQNGFILTFEKM